MDSGNLEIWQKLNRAVVAGKIDDVAEILDVSPQLIFPSEELGSILHTAAQFGQLEVIRLFVSRGADINWIDDCYGSILDCASRDGHVGVVSYLLAQHATIDVSLPERNPLFGAIYGNHFQIAKTLLEHGIDPHVIYRGASGKLKNALSFAIDHGQTEVANLLREAGCRLPIEGVDVAVNEKSELSQPSGKSDAHEQLVAHLTEQFGPVDPLALQEILLIDESVHVAVHVIRPNEHHPFLTLFTLGMSDQAMRVPEGEESYQYAELIMHLPADWPLSNDLDEGRETFWPLQWLRNIAYYPHQAETWLGGAHTIISSDEPPVPLGPNTQQTCLLLLADFADWSPVELADGRRVRFYTVFPIYTQERDFEIRHGVTALLERMEQAGIPAVVDVNRANVAQ